MKITIELSDVEVKGIKAYLKAVDDLQRPSKKDITSFILSLTSAMYSPSESVSDYIRLASDEKGN